MARILVVDDEPICTQALECLLGDEGHEVQAVASGEEAIEIAVSFEPEALISDWKLTGRIDGIEVARRLQALNPQLAVILISGLPAKDLQELSHDIRISSILEKPCDLDVVAQATEEALGSKTAEVASACR